jgi:hypothetical protein
MGRNTISIVQYVWCAPCINCHRTTVDSSPLQLRGAVQWVALSRVAVCLALGFCEPSGMSLDNFTAYSAGFVALGVSQSFLVQLALTAVS